MQSIRSRLLPLSCLVVLPLAIACEREPEPVPADTPPAAVEGVTAPADLVAANDRFIDAWNASDAATIASFFTDDATVAIVGEDTYRGRDEIVAEWVEPGVEVVRDLEVEERATERDGDDYRSTGTYTHGVDLPDAEPIVISGTFTTTWTQDADGQWQIRSIELEEDERPEADERPEG